MMTPIRFRQAMESMTSEQSMERRGDITTETVFSLLRELGYGEGVSILEAEKACIVVVGFDWPGSYTHGRG
jgi:hypothetical protein